VGQGAAAATTHKFVCVRSEKIRVDVVACGVVVFGAGAGAGAGVVRSV